MKDKIIKKHIIAGGQNSRYILIYQCNDRATASIQIITRNGFNGTTATAKFLQSNNMDLDYSEWNELPEQDLTLEAGSNLVQTKCFTCLFLAIEINEGDATAGELEFHQNLQ